LKKGNTAGEPAQPQEQRRTRKIVPDTGVLAEYIIEKAPYRAKAEKILREAATGNIELLLTPITLSETLYVASRIYEAASLPRPNEEALNYILWLKTIAKTVEADEETAIRAGELKKTLRIALPDCYVIAAAEKTGATPLFRKPEEEMKPVLGELKRLGVKFLDETP